MPDPTNAVAKSHKTPSLYSGAVRYQDALFSMNSFASLILVARYGLPPRSGWFRSIICRCFFRIISFVAPRSLCSNWRQSYAPYCTSSSDQTIPLTVSPKSTPLLVGSSFARSLLCRTLVQAHWCRRDISGEQLVLLFPANILELRFHRHTVEAYKESRRGNANTDCKYCRHSRKKRSVMWMWMLRNLSVVGSTDAGTQYNDLTGSVKME